MLCKGLLLTNYIHQNPCIVSQTIPMCRAMYIDFACWCVTPKLIIIINIHDKSISLLHMYKTLGVSIRDTPQLLCMIDDNRSHD